MRSRLAVAGLAVSFAAIAAIGGARLARACSCATPEVMPFDGSTGVPLNTRVWVPDGGRGGSSTVSPPRLRPVGGLLVDFDVSAIQDASGLRYKVLKPKAPLAPMTRYVVETVDLRGSTTSSFTTGEVADTTAPAPPAGRVTKSCAARTPQSSCGEYSRSLRFEIPTSDKALAVITTGGQPPPPSLDQSPQAWPPDPNPVIFAYRGTRTEFGLGQSACIHWPISQPAGTIFFGAVDLAGNFSGWHAGGPVALPDYPKVAIADPDKHCVDPSMASTGGPLPFDAGPPPDGGVTPPDNGMGCAIGDRDVSALPVALLAALTLIGLGRRRRSQY
jgi:hypothetical protein